jgi:hypothetical protein
MAFGLSSVLSGYPGSPRTYLELRHAIQWVNWATLFQI